VPGAPRPGFSGTPPSNLADRVLQPADRVLQPADRVLQLAFRHCGRPAGPRSSGAMRRAACPRCTRRSRSLRGGRSRGGRRDREGRTMNPSDRPLVVQGSGPLSSCCWSSPGPPAGRNRRPHRPQRRRTNAAVNSPGGWARRSRRYGRPSQERSREQRGAADGRRAVVASAERSSV
jgi:hypothetical protein